MNAKLVLSAALLALTTGLAGCTGGFNVEQTEPIRVQLDGAPETVKVADDADPQKIVVENPDNVDVVEVEVKVTQTSDDPVTVIVKVQDSESKEILAQREVTVAGNSSNTSSSTSSSSSGNMTTSSSSSSGLPEETTSSGDTVVQNIVVNVHGKDNFVVITEAPQGEADVDIAAHASDFNQGDGNVTASP